MHSSAQLGHHRFDANGPHHCLHQATWKRVYVHDSDWPYRWAQGSGTCRVRNAYTFGNACLYSFESCTKSVLMLSPLRGIRLSSKSFYPLQRYSAHRFRRRESYIRVYNQPSSLSLDGLLDAELCMHKICKCLCNTRCGGSCVTRAFCWFYSTMNSLMVMYTFRDVIKTCELSEILCVRKSPHTPFTATTKHTQTHAPMFSKCLRIYVYGARFLSKPPHHKKHNTHKDPGIKFQPVLCVLRSGWCVDCSLKERAWMCGNIQNQHRMYNYTLYIVVCHIEYSHTKTPCV